MTTNDDKQVVVVQGSAEMRVAANLALISIVVETSERKSSRAAQSANAAKAERVLKALKATGVAHTVLRTDVTLHTVYHANKDEKKDGWYEYEARNAVTLETAALSGVAALVDAAAGVESVQIEDVEFTLDFATRCEKTLVALAQAAKMARRKAKMIAEQVNAVVVRVWRAEETMTSIMQPRAFYAAGAESAPATPVVAGPIEVRAGISLTVEIAHIDECEADE